MENLIFLIFLLIIFFLQALGQILERKKKEIPQEETPFPEITWEDTEETQEKQSASEKEEIPVEIIEEEKKEESVETKKEIEAEPEEKEETISLDELEKAIIYSTIIGPPKAYKICRSGGIGRHA